MSTWIAVAERLPTEDERVLIWIPGVGTWPGQCTIGHLDGGGDWHEVDEPLYTIVPSHWQALPPGPEHTQREAKQRERQELGDRRDWDGLEALGDE